MEKNSSHSLILCVRWIKADLRGRPRLHFWRLSQNILVNLCSSFLEKFNCNLNLKGIKCKPSVLWILQGRQKISARDGRIQMFPLIVYTCSFRFLMHFFYKIKLFIVKWYDQMKLSQMSSWRIRKWQCNSLKKNLSDFSWKTFFMVNSINNQSLAWICLIISKLKLCLQWVSINIRINDIILFLRIKR